MTEKKCMLMQTVGITVMTVIVLLLVGLVSVKKPFSMEGKPMVSQGAQDASVVSKDPEPACSVWDEMEESRGDFFSQYFDRERAENLSEAADRFAPFRFSHGVCMRWVRKILTYVPKSNGEEAPIQDFNQLPYDYQHTMGRGSKAKKGSPLPGRSARDFMRWAEHNPVSLCTTLGLASVSEEVETPFQKGFVLAYEPGQCGFSRQWGHIEIVTDSEGPSGPEAASDYRRVISAPACKPSMVLVPVRSCEFLSESHAG